MNNPKAFPMNWVKQEAPNLNVIFEQQGMTLRDYFAAKAMQGLIGCPDWRENVNENAEMEASEFTALTAYLMADAMLKAREQ
jgi:hypothetical protein